ncbi:MAG: sel1 repeat family protein, partial [Gammaproteobacteria bacterium]|nr:sel1 repeat family protein [Gammaproteobacteria bacterium]
DNIDRFSENNIAITQDIAAEILGIEDSMNITMDESIDLGINQDTDEAADMMVASVAPTSTGPAPSSLAAVDYERGLAYAFGEGVTKDLETAFQYFKQAAEKDYAPAQYKIGVAYAYAEGTPADKSQAANWYEMAAMQGHTIAQRNLGVMLENGDGIQQDKIKALAWYNILANSGNVMDIRRRDALSNELSQADLTESDRITAELQNMISQVN